MNELLFPDESRFNLSFANRCIHIWRHKGEPYDNGNVIEQDCFGGGSVIMVWRGILSSGKNRTCNCGR